MRNIIPSLLWFSVLAPACFAKTNPCVPLPATASAGSAHNVLYLNRDYGFSFQLPSTWRGFAVKECFWQGHPTDAREGAEEEGPLIVIRHPLSTEPHPREDIPIMVFTRAQWRRIENQSLAVSAAPIPPSLIGRNHLYVFATPPRFFYDYLDGYQEVLEILRSKPLRAIRIVPTSKAAEQSR